MRTQSEWISLTNHLYKDIPPFNDSHILRKWDLGLQITNFSGKQFSPQQSPSLEVSDKERAMAEHLHMVRKPQFESARRREG
jgi:hypothetical protein